VITPVLADYTRRDLFAGQPDHGHGIVRDYPIDVPITFAVRSVPTRENAGQHSAQSSVDNCYRDQAVTNARQLADLLNSADAAVVGPSG
jgi:hypothetical protein